MERVRLGDRPAATALVRAFLRPAYSVALAIVGRPADAEDVAQEALVTALERIDTCREPARFAAWLFQIVRNRALNWIEWRRHHDVRDAETPEVAVDGPAERIDVRARLVEALALLAPIQREIVLLHDLENFSHAEIAAAVEISEVMSRQHLFQARRILRVKLANDGPEVKA